MDGHCTNIKSRLSSLYAEEKRICLSIHEKKWKDFESRSKIIKELELKRKT